MADTSWWGVRQSAGGGSTLLLSCIFMAVPPSLLQPPVPLSLPVHMTVSPAAWRFLPLSQSELRPLFSNSSPFSFSQSLFMLPPATAGPRPSLQASFGSYSVTQLMSEPFAAFAPRPSASLLSEHVERERDEGGRVRFTVRALIHQQGDSGARGTRVTLHAFRETEEHKASCVTQPPLGLCVVTLTLPSGWFEDRDPDQSRQSWDIGHGNIQPRRQAQTRQLQWGRHHRSSTHQMNLRLDSDTIQVLVGAPRQMFRGPSGTDGAQPAIKYSFTTPLMQWPTQSCSQQETSNWSPPQFIVTSFLLTYFVEPFPRPSKLVEDRAAQSQKQLVYIKAVTLREEQRETDGEPRRPDKEDEACVNGQTEDTLSLDSHVTIRYHRGPVMIGTPVRVSVSLRANVSAESVVIRLKVKKGLVSMVAQRSLTSDLWAVTLERSQGSKQDVLSIRCHKHGALEQTHGPALLQQVACLSVDGLKRSFGVAMTVSVNWWVEYSGHVNHSSARGPTVSVFSFADRRISGIAPITEGNTIINTAILSSQPVSLPVIVLAISHSGKASDVTSAVTCYSTDENTVKVSSDCSTLFVDGSESGLGGTCVVVEFLLGTLSGSVCLQVWAPSVPLRVYLVDPVLNVIDGWNRFTDTGQEVYHLCEPVYQRSSVQVLTQFTAQDSHSRTTYLLNSSDWFVDVTELVRDWLRVEDPRVASLGPQNNVIGLRPGKTSLHVVSEQWDGLLGSCDITVTSEPVIPGDLSVQVVSGLGMSVTGDPSHPSVVTATVTAHNVLHDHHQEASISVWLQFSDDTASLLSFFSDLSFFLRLSSLADTVVEVAPGSSQRVFAQGNGGGPLLRAELLVSTCTDKLITVNSISDGDWDWMDTRGRGGTRRLAKGSGWIRVNLDLGFLHPTGNVDEEFDFDISDTLVESESDVYASHLDQDNRENASSDYYDQIKGRISNRRWNKFGNGGMVSRNNLERAVVMPSQDEGAVYVSPGQEEAAEEQQEQQEQGAQELELGLGAVLSLLCLCAVLFLANCLPCALRDRMRTTAEEDGEAKPGTREEAGD